MAKKHYPQPKVVQQPQPQLIDKMLSSGETHEGWIVLQVPKEVTNPLLIFDREFVGGVYGVWGYMWFALFPNRD